VRINAKAGKKFGRKIQIVEDQGGGRALADDLSLVDQFVAQGIPHVDQINGEDGEAGEQQRQGAYPEADADDFCFKGEITKVHGEPSYLFTRTAWRKSSALKWKPVSDVSL